MTNKDNDKTYHDLHCRIPREIWDEVERLRKENETTTDFVCAALRTAIVNRRKRGKR